MLAFEFPNHIDLLDSQHLNNVIIIVLYIKLLYIDFMNIPWQVNSDGSGTQVPSLLQLAKEFSFGAKPSLQPNII